ncbi:hypothetical protein NMY22_g13344 [Coprinellus aureogranulatus]|nr:hypothetical protein NMY22_g13344 [Coprinellus aureogranulatus]
MYKVKRTWDHYYCACPAWRNQSGAPVDARSCKHLASLLGAEYEAARLNWKNPDGPIPKAPAAKGKGKGKAAKGDGEGGKVIPDLLLATKWDLETGSDPTGWWISEKLDGVRAYYDGQGTFYSRLGNPFPAPKWFTDPLPSGVALDGELFAGRGNFQSAVSIVKTQNSERWKAGGVLRGLFGERGVDEHERVVKGGEEGGEEDEKEGEGEGKKCKHVNVLEHVQAKSREHVLRRLKEVEALGGEGVMLRQPGSQYEGKRSNTLQKVKTFFDAEAVVTGHTAGQGKHAGSTGALECKMASGKKFAVGSGLSDKQRKNPPKVGSIIVYRFQELTRDGVPRFPTFVGEAADKTEPKDAEVPATRKVGRHHHGHSQNYPRELLDYDELDFGLERREFLEELSTRELIDELADRLERRGNTISKAKELVKGKKYGCPYCGAKYDTPELLAGSGQLQREEQLSQSLTRSVFRQELQSLVDEQAAWRFNALHAAVQSIEAFRVEEMATIMERVAPNLWNLVQDLLGMYPTDTAPKPDETSAEATEGLEDPHWEYLEEGDIGEIIKVITSSPQDLETRRLTIRQETVVIISIMMHSVNQQVNALASIIGIFLHASGTPERVIEAFAHMGISISLNTIHNAISSLSFQAAQLIRRLGQSLLVAYAYDNFDIDLPTKTPTVEQGTASTLKHFTSALIFPLQHDVTKDDLKCSDYLWARSRLNPDAKEEDIPPQRGWRDLLTLHRESMPRDTPSRRDKFNSWKFLSDLIQHGPPYFKPFEKQLELPDAVDAIPLVKTPTHPVRAMEYSNSTVSGNISTILDLARQGGIGDPQESGEGVEDVSKHVVMFHGDLGTGDRILAILLRRSIEDTAWRRFQFVIFVPGFFHFKMACVDALWKIFIQPVDARQDPTSLICDVGVLRPRETGKVTSEPGYRRMLEVIQHAGICRRLDCWLVYAATRFTSQENNIEIRTLQDYADLKPSFEDLQKVANELVTTYVAAPQKLYRLRDQPEERRDQQFENATLFHKLSLLFEETSHAMNYGDIGRIETCVVHWIAVFRAINKHKYASHLTRFFTETNFVYPSRLCRAVRYHTLINPTGKEGKSRGVDWCVELNNMSTKAEHGGSSSNRTSERIIKESILVEAYKNAKLNIDRNFVLTHLTSAHSPPDLRATFDELCKLLFDNNTHRITPGRKAIYEMPDAIEKGMSLLLRGDVGDLQEEDEGVTGTTRPEMEDVLIELVV